MLPADDVIDLMWETRTILVYEAVFAAALCTNQWPLLDHSDINFEISAELSAGSKGAR